MYLDIIPFSSFYNVLGYDIISCDALCNHGYVSLYCLKIKIKYDILEREKRREEERLRKRRKIGNLVLRMNILANTKEVSR